MSSEAACFPDSLATTQESRKTPCAAPEIAPDLPVCASEEVSRPEASISKTSDERLMEQIREGEEGALGLLFRRYARAVRNVAYRILQNEEEADDLVQEVFLFIFRKAGLYDSTHGKASSWIVHVAYHRAFDRRRYLKSRRFYTSRELVDTDLGVADLQGQAPYYEQSIEAVLGKRALAHFTSRLTREQQETIRLYFFEGYALREIAQLTGRSLVNVRSHYYRGLERMRKFVFPEKMRSK